MFSRSRGTFRRWLSPGATPGTIGSVKFAPALAVELEVEAHAERRLLESTAAVWKKLGERDPHWSVLTWEKFRKEAFGERAEVEFYETGRDDLAAVEHAFARAGEDFSAVGTVLELGCGAGRVTEHFARGNRQVQAFDISEPLLELARARMRKLGLANVAFTRLSDAGDIVVKPRVDLAFTIIVLQHNPPPVQHRLLAGMFESVRPGGFVYFQIPTYIFGYSFSVATYRPQTESMEMHCMPMGDVLALMRRSGVDLLEALQDDSSGSDRIVSHTFFGRKQQRNTESCSAP